MKRPCALIILDGWGIGDKAPYNAIYKAHTPFFDHLWEALPHTRLEASGEFVGLPEGQIGGSEVGHLTIGAGSVVMQDLPRLTKYLEQPESHGVPDNQTVQKLIAYARKKPLHIIGMLSEGGVHSHMNHLYLLLDILQKSRCKEPYIHFISDGRDTMPKVAHATAQHLLKHLQKTGYGTPVTLIGRYFAMDRDTNWDRTQKALDLYLKAAAHDTFTSLPDAISRSYSNDITDEFIEPAASKDFKGIREGEPVFFLNFRSDRMRQIVAKFHEVYDQDKVFTMMPYDESLDLQSLFHKPIVEATLSAVLDELGASQLKAAESEKAPHVTYFFNGGKDIQFIKERRTIEKSNTVKHDEIPEMKAEHIVRNIQTYVAEQKPDFILVNFANPDMVGHTGNFEAVVKGVEKVDAQLKNLCAFLTQHNYVCLITADHGNAEIMYDPDTKEPHTAHTLSQVPFIVYDLGSHNALLQKEGLGLHNIAGTVCDIMGVHNDLIKDSLIIH